MNKETLRLTERQFEVLTHILRGTTNAEIAALLGIKRQTIKDYVHILNRHFDCRNRTELVVYMWANHVTDEFKASLKRDIAYNHKRIASTERTHRMYLEEPNE